MNGRRALRACVDRVTQSDELNFLVTNRIPRRLATRLMGWFSRIEQPIVRDLSIAIWRATSDLDLSEARATHFRSLHDCFVRELKPGSRPLDPDPAVLVSPSDGIVGACGAIEDGQVFQAKGLPYRLHELVGDVAAAAAFDTGTFVTLRLTATMYHRFHAPHDGTVDRVTYIAGDTWNVNPPALKRIERLYCRNERAVVRLGLASGGESILLVPVAAILVASIRLHFADVLLHMGYRGPREIPCAARVARGQELGWFEHGSTIIVLAPPGFELAPAVRDGHRIRMGEALLRRVDA